MAEEFKRWKAEVAELLARLSERFGEAEELRRLVERADYRLLPRILTKMAALALFAPELKSYLPDLEAAKRWMEAERARRLEIIRRYAARGGEGKVVAKYMCDRLFDPNHYEFFELLEYRYPGLLPIEQPEIEGTYVYDARAHATLVLVDREEFLRKYKGRRLMAVVHVIESGRDEYFIEVINTEDLFEER
jgi:hypothetical protein